MVSIKYSILVLACISAVAISFGLSTPYAIGNSIGFDENYSTQTEFSNPDLDEVEFTGDAVSILDNYP